MSATPESDDELIDRANDGDLDAAFDLLDVLRGE